jgi:outer membrane receptor protein involved in Fe transport
MRKSIYPFAIGASVLCTGPLFAQAASGTGGVVKAADAHPSSDAVPEIIVTAQKRQQALSDVGLTIVAASSQQLKDAGIANVASLVKISPGLTVTRNNNGYAIFSLRGVNYNASQLSALPAVSVYLDEAGLPYPALTEGALLDVERVEVLKGPQGTLFGQNATGGSINIIAAKPTDHLAVGGEASVNNWGGVSLQGYVSGPLTDTLNARLAASTDQFGAWQKGYFGNHQKNGDANKAAARLLLDWRPTDRLKVSLNLNGNYDHGEPQAYQFAFPATANAVTSAPGLLTYPAPPKSDRAADIDTGFNPYSHNDFYQGVLRADYDVLDNLTLTSQTNYIHYKTRELRDGDGTVIPILFQGPRGSIRSVSQEFRATGKIPSANLNYILGANYQNDKIADGTFLDIPFYSALPHGSNIFADYHVRYRSTGLFANADWEFLPHLTLTAGARYTWTREAMKGCLADGGNGLNAAFFSGVSNLFRGLEGYPQDTAIPAGGCITLNDIPPNPTTLPTYAPYDADLQQKEHNVSWRAGLNYKPARGTLFYALASRGYKSGGFPAALSTNASEFQPVKQEQLTSYEVGTKLSFFDGKVRADVAGFYYDYKDKQVQVYYLSALGRLATYTNIPKATVKGIDVDLTLVPFRGLTIHPAFTYLKSKAGNFVTLNGAGVFQNIKGNSLNYAPKLTGTVDAQYDFRLGSYDAYVGGNLHHESKTFADLGESANQLIPGYTTYDARIGVKAPSGWYASVWIRNLTDKYYYTNVFTSGDVFERPTGLPRTFGGTFGVNF